MQPLRLTTQDTATLLRVSPQTVRDYVTQGRLRARCEGKHLYFLPREVEAFCQAMPVYGDGAATPDPEDKKLRRRGSKKAG